MRTGGGLMESPTEFDNAGHVVPELFVRSLTDKESEAVANPAKYTEAEGSLHIKNKSAAN